MLLQTILPCPILFADVFANVAKSGWDGWDWLLRWQAAPLNAFPFCSPQGQLRSLKVDCHYFLLSFSFYEQVRSERTPAHSRRKKKRGLTRYHSSFPSARRRGNSEVWKRNATIFLLSFSFYEQVRSEQNNKKSLAYARLSNFGWKMGMLFTP